jgi:amino-acid N-acetyltransferase
VTLIIEPASPDDVNPVLDLLGRTRLPTEGVREVVGTLCVARRDGQVVGCAALEVYGASALVRSVAVEPSCHGQGLGRRLVAAVEGLASRHGVGELFLLTETAATFFAALGYSYVDRGGVPADVRASAEFAWVCPASASVMRKALRPA